VWLMRFSSEAKVGLTLLLGLFLLGSMAVAVGRVELRPSEGPSFEIMYKTVDGLKEGAPVRYAGVNVGRVSFIRLEPEGVRVGIRLDRELLIPDDSRFVIATVGVLGDKHVEIHPGQAQEPLEAGTELRGVDPVMMDSILVEMDTTLRNLNQVVRGFADIADSEELKEGVVESTVLMRDTIGGLQSAVEQVNMMTGTVTEITTQVESFTKQLSETQLDQIAANLESFTDELALLELQQSLDEFQVFTRRLNEIPVEDVTDELTTLTRSLNRLDLDGLEREVRQFTGMMADLDLRPLLTEVTEVTQQISRLDLDKRGEELAEFTGKLAAMPLEEFADDLRAITKTVKTLPLEEVGDSVYHFTQELEAIPIATISEDLQLLTAELRELGLTEMAGDVKSFTGELAALDIDGKMDELTADFREFSSRLNQLQLETVFLEMQETMEHLSALGRTVDPDDVEEIMADLQLSAGNVRDASGRLTVVMDDIQGDTKHLVGEAEDSLKQVQQSLAGIDGLVSDIQRFVEDMAADGKTAESVKAILANVEESTADVKLALNSIQTDLPLTSDTFEEIRETMDSIQRINRDIQTIRGVGESVDVSPRLALGSTFQAGDHGRSLLTADAVFELEPHDSDQFYVVGLSDIPDRNAFQLQYGVEGARFRQRYGIIDTKLGVGLDGKITDEWTLTGEARFEDNIKLRLRTDYEFLPSWWLHGILDDFTDPEDLNLRFGIERRF